MSYFAKKNLTRSAVKLTIAAVALGVVVAAVSACGSASNSAGQLAADQQILATCDAAAPPATDVQLDGSGSSNSDAIVEERFKAIESVVRTTAICGGRLRVSVFSSTSAATNILIDKSLRLDGATDNARLKKLPPLVTDVMKTIRASYGSAAKSLPSGGTDISAEYRLASEWLAQVGAPHRLYLYLLTDGFQNVGVTLDQGAITKQQAADLAGRVAVPQLPGSSIVVAGLGRVASDPPSSDVVDGLVAFYDALCKKTAAASCASVTDYAVSGR
ncbi:hypothetical protein ACIRSS_15900 [Amycolatopsis sp. NPDC101161]|uniref:hypothetical protein n=1 Tax=Amycolatopsis sp. NPDC101161 TaxID=3363940 RepID=UPI0037FF96E5